MHPRAVLEPLVTLAGSTQDPRDHGDRSCARSSGRPGRGSAPPPGSSRLPRGLPEASARSGHPIEATHEKELNRLARRGSPVGPRRRHRRFGQDPRHRFAAVLRGQPGPRSRPRSSAGPRPGPRSRSEQAALTALGLSASPRCRTSCSGAGKTTRRDPHRRAGHPPEPEGMDASLLAVLESRGLAAGRDRARSPWRPPLELATRRRGPAPTRRSPASPLVPGGHRFLQAGPGREGRRRCREGRLREVLRGVPPAGQTSASRSVPTSVPLADKSPESTADRDPRPQPGLRVARRQPRPGDRRWPAALRPDRQRDGQRGLAASPGGQGRRRAPAATSRRWRPPASR